MDCRNIQLSIIIPVYNTEPYLEKCLQSVVNAADGIEHKIEVLIINDGSPDNSGDIIDKFCAKYGNWMKRFDKPNGGLSDVKNFGLEHANGKYVIFLDSDDYIEREMYRDMLQKIDEEGADIVVCDIRLTYDDETKNTIWPCAVKTRNETFAQVVDMPMMPASWNKIVKKELYEGLSFPVGFNNEDVAVTPIVLGRAKKIVIVEKPYYNYYQRAGSIQNSTFNEKRFVILKTSKMCFDRMENLPNEKEKIIKGSIYLHQVLSMAFYPIRYEKFFSRYKLLKIYMKQVDNLFPDIWENFEVKEFQTWETKYMQLYRKISCYLLQRKYYFLTSVFWAICNTLHALKRYIKKHIFV